MTLGKIRVKHKPGCGPMKRRQIAVQIATTAKLMRELGR